MEQASGSAITGIRAFSAHLPLTSLLYSTTILLLLFGSSSTFRWKPVSRAFCVMLKISSIYDDGGPFLSRLIQTLCTYHYH